MAAETETKTKTDMTNKEKTEKRRAQKCSVGVKALMMRHDASKHERCCEGPCEICQVDNDRMVRTKKGKVTETVNIRRLKPFKEQQLNKKTLVKQACC